ncbi:MAG: RnfABCDGE type electron transport complex subunit B, partial [Anaerococcus vaginalis]|nr:RnfABCDGE type electron transport complex subunit B [Anaerococcus vaginalis]
MNNILIPTLVLAILGFVLAGLLGVISKKFEVETDPIVERVRDALPGANCGACGYPGCDGCANAIAKGEAPVSACVIGGQSVTDAVASAMGVESAGAGDKQVAVVKCNGTCENAKDL